MDDESQKLRDWMVDTQIVSRGVSDPETIKAMRTIHRHLFLPEKYRDAAYDDGAQPIGEGQTISQPYIVAAMTEAAKVSKDSKILEIGTGSGYQAAVLAEIGCSVFTIERIEPLGKSAAALFKTLNYQNIKSKIGDGTLGWPENAPYDAILVTAGAPVVPEALVDQLAAGGRLIIPVGDHFMQHLKCITKNADKSQSETLLDTVRFVPLIGTQGWNQ